MAEISGAGKNSKTKEEGALSFDPLNLHWGDRYLLQLSTELSGKLILLLYFFTGTTPFWDIPPLLHLETSSTEAPRSPVLSP